MVDEIDNAYAKRIAKLRNIMKNDGIAIYIIPTSDYHQSEYTNAYFNEREYMTGFTGSAGTLVVDDAKAWLFTDGRYYIQAEKQLDGSGIILMRAGMEGVPSVNQLITELAEKHSDNNTTCNIAFDGRVMSAINGQIYEKIAARYNGVVIYEKDYVDEIWEGRPSLPGSKAFILEEKYTGESYSSKVERLREVMSQAGCDTLVCSTLDDICWLYNIRGNDIECNPVVLSMAIITLDDSILYIDESKLTAEVKDYFLANAVTLRGYYDIYNDAEKITDATVWVDKKRINYALFKKLSKNVNMIYMDNPLVLMKSIKNNIEIDNLKAAHVKDGLAVTRFIKWLKETVTKENYDKGVRITEADAADYIDNQRRLQDGFIELSFNTISAYGQNAAMMHYTATHNDCAELKPEGMLLVDSGGQYYEGTTDVTRTIGLGDNSDEAIKHYTLVLKGMLNLANTKFLYGCNGFSLDVMARQPLWNIGMDYRCGTGHGIGYLLNVHENPNGFRWRHNPGVNDLCIFEEGMVTSDEPGVYIEGEYGIRTENEIVCRKDVHNEYGQFMRFEFLTAVPIDMSLVDVSLLNEEDKRQLNNYNKFVYSTLSEYLNENEREWLRKYTYEI